MVKGAISWYSSSMDLAEILKNHVRNRAIFYVTLDPERALGLEDVLPTYTIICPYTSQLTEKLKRTHDRGQGVGVVVLEEHLAEADVKKIVERGTYGILQSEFVKKYIKGNVRGSTPYIMVLKNSQLIEDFCKKQGWKLLAPKAKIAEQCENKISQYKLLKNVVPYPDSVVGSLGLRMFPKSNPSKSPLFVLQFNRGHSGNSTFFIKSAEGLDKFAKKFPKREVKISEYINGKTYTLNCLVLSAGEVVMGSLSEQITGLKSATNNPNTTCGNDFTSPRKLAAGKVREIQKIAQNVGTALYKKGYKGLFGIDVIIQTKTGRVYFIEVNTHQPASISFEAKLHRKIGKVPLLAYFILDNVGVQKKSIKKFRQLAEPPIILSIKAKQIIYRNKTSKVLRRKDVAAKYKNKGLISRMQLIKPNEEIYRKQEYKNGANRQ